MITDLMTGIVRNNDSHHVTSCKCGWMGGEPREVLMGVGDGVASGIMLTFTKKPSPHADFYSEARPPC